MIVIINKGMEKMKKRIFTVTIIIGVLAGLLVGCNGFLRLLENEQDGVINSAKTIADFVLPEGYSPEFAVELMDYTVVSFKPNNTNSHLYLIQALSDSDGENMLASLDNLVENAGPSQTDLALIESIPMTVRGTETNLMISEGINGEGISYRQAMVVFEGKGGIAMLILSEPLTRWNQDAVEAFIQSIE